MEEENIPERMVDVEVLSLDEVTVDVDVFARMDLLEFFKEECEQRGCTIVYATHIFDGLESWATDLAYIQDGELKRKRCEKGSVSEERETEDSSSNEDGSDEDENGSDEKGSDDKDDGESNEEGNDDEDGESDEEGGGEDEGKSDEEGGGEDEGDSLA
ncbi:ABC transporter I family member 21 [Artemisia annua]|uniref:ABC transporter I family member 21 n=1 Tax=Artemisia annua TaxID=35608 RepID=A0A2U1QDP0_ARTAN|nr:ABC transporter I family member 21 [Artemisia annua]